MPVISPYVFKVLSTKIKTSHAAIIFPEFRGKCGSARLIINEVTLVFEIFALSFLLSSPHIKKGQKKERRNKSANKEKG